MNLMKLFFRDRTETSVDVFEAWEVRWRSRYGQFSSDTQPEVKVFPKEEDAKEFKKALEDAFKLIKHTSGTYVELKRQ